MLVYFNSREDLLMRYALLGFVVTLTVLEVVSC